MRQSTGSRSPRTPSSRAIVAFAAVAALALVVPVVGCTPPGEDVAGTGGTPGMSSGGAPSTGSGGAPSTGSGGAPSTASGGAPSTGSGGAPSTGSGGAPSTGSGGAPSTGSGGRAGSGGASSSGGAAQDAAASDARDGGTATGGAASGGRSGTGGNPGGCTDSCPATKGGLTINCQKRFMTGVNFAWVNFASDFGGGTRGIAATRSSVRTKMQDMKANGVDVVRWWMHPNFTGGGVTFNGSSPTGLGSTEMADINAALSLAAEVGVWLKLTIFSFDNFKPDMMSGHSLTPIIQDATRRKALIDNVVRPIARAVAASPNAARNISWDVINEPEWAISGSDGKGDMPFDPNTALQTVTFSVMETFVKEVVAALKAETPSTPVTVGQAAIKWSRAFTGVGLDYYDMHFYGWVDQSFPIGNKSFADYGIGDKPVVVGEFPLQGWTNTNGTMTASQIMNKVFDSGYAGAKAWAFTQDGMWSSNKGNVATFATAKGCSTKY